MRCKHGFTPEDEVATDADGRTSCCGAFATYMDSDLACKCCYALVTAGEPDDPIVVHLPPAGALE